MTLAEEMEAVIESGPNAVPLERREVVLAALEGYSMAKEAAISVATDYAAGGSELSTIDPANYLPSVSDRRRGGINTAESIVSAIADGAMYARTWPGLGQRFRLPMWRPRMPDGMPRRG